MPRFSTATLSSSLGGVSVPGSHLQFDEKPRSVLSSVSGVSSPACLTQPLYEKYNQPWAHCKEAVSEFKCVLQIDLEE